MRRLNSPQRRRRIMAGSAVNAAAATPSAAAEEAPITFDEAVPKLVDYLRSHRSYSPSTVGAYTRDLRIGSPPYMTDALRGRLGRFHGRVAGTAVPVVHPAPTRTACPADAGGPAPGGGAPAPGGPGRRGIPARASGRGEENSVRIACQNMPGGCRSEGEK